MIVDFRDPTSIQALRLLVKECAKADQVIGLTSGVYDLFHHLHLNYLERCAGRCDFLVVGVDSDDIVRANKGTKRPIYNEIQRLALVNSQQVVAVAFIIRDLKRDFGGMAEILEPIIFKNIEYQETVGAEHAREVQIIADVKNISSTSMAVESIVADHIEEIKTDKPKPQTEV